LRKTTKNLSTTYHGGEGSSEMLVSVRRHISGDTNLQSAATESQILGNNDSTNTVTDCRFSQRCV
jgi:hypothetical protein